MATRSGYTLHIFLVDVSGTMATTRVVETGLGDKKVKKEVSNIEYGLDFVRAKVGDMLLAGLKTVHCAVVLFGCDETDNCLHGNIAGYDYLWEYIKPGQPNPNTLLKIDAIPRFVSKTEAADKGDALSAIILGAHLFDQVLGTKKWTRQMTIVTDGESATDWSAAQETSDKMARDKVGLTVVGLDFDDEEMGIRIPNKSESKRDNETMYHRLCESLGEESICGNAEVAVPDAVAPRMKIVKPVATPYTLTIGCPETDEATLHELGYDTNKTLRINVQVRKCTMQVRPMGAKNMTRAGVRIEKAKEQRFLEKTLAAKTGVKPGKGKDKAADAMDLDSDDEDSDDDLAPEDILAGLVERTSRYVYINPEGVHSQRGAKRKRADGDGDDDEEEEGEDPEEAPLETAQKDNLQKAYKYGATLVPIPDLEEDALRMHFQASRLEVTRFIPTDSIPRHHLLGDVSYLFANEDQSQAQLLLSALIHAMFETGRSALCRFVSRYKNAEPKMVVLIPTITRSMQFCWMIQVPFAEDLREYLFPPLFFIRTRSGKTLREHANLPTDEMKRKMESFVDDMDLMDDPEGESGRGWLDLEDAYSPSVHYLKACILQRLTHPDSEDLPPVHPDLSKYLSPPEFVKERSKGTVEELKKLLNIKKVPPKVKTNKRKGGPHDFADETQDIDLDAILGSGYTASATAKAASTQPSATAAPKAGGSGMTEKERTEMAIKASQKPTQPTRKGGDDSDSDRTVASDEGSDNEDASSPRREQNGRTSKGLVGVQNPLEDFKKAIDNSEVEGSDLVGEAVTSMLQAVEEIVKTSFSRSQFPKAVECLKAVREVARQQDETDTYNKFLRSFKESLHSPGFKNKDFWLQIRDHKLGLIRLDESESEEGVTKKEADRFYES